MATAKESYKKRQVSIANKILKLQAALKQHAKKFSKEDKNWGYVGDLGWIDDGLSSFDNFMRNNK